MLKALVATLAVVAALANPAAAGKSCSAQEGQLLLESGRLDAAVREFSCVIAAEPTAVDGYRGRIEAELLLGRYSDAVRDYARVTAFVLPAHPDAADIILSGYAARLAAVPADVAALTGASFARWWFFDYAQAVHLLDRLLDLRPDDVYANLFRGSSRLLLGATPGGGVADLERALALAPVSPDVRFIVADAYTYGRPDPARAFAEASLALAWGLATPRVYAILAAAENAFGDVAAAAAHIDAHIDLVTTDLVAASPLAAGDAVMLDLVPGRSYAIPLPAVAGERLAIATTSRDFFDSIAVLLGPDGAPVAGSDDTDAYFAAFDTVAAETGSYTMIVTSFEAVSAGALEVSRDD